MPTIVTHAIVPLAAAAMLGQERIPPPVAIAGAVLAMLPDLDVVGLRLGVPYDSQWGHRGASHSFAVAAALALLAIALRPSWRSPGTALYLFASASSHGLLDCLTDGIKGVALLWPITPERLFAPWRPIRVSPIGEAFFTQRGLETLRSEMLLVWLPCALAVLAAVKVRRSAAA